MKLKHLRAISDLTRSNTDHLLERAFYFQRQHRRGVRREAILNGEVIAMIFEKPSLRTKVAFEVAAHYLGAQPVFLSSSQILESGGNQRGRESIPDIARNLERFGDLIVARVYDHGVIEEIANAVKIPIINALCDKHHPTQALADLMAIRMFFPDKNRKVKVAFVGDGNNVSTSLMQICALMGINFTIASPPGYALSEVAVDLARQSAEKSGSTIELGSDPYEAVRGASVVYADTYVSMGQEKEKLQRSEDFIAYQITENLMKHAAADAIFLHCLPAYRGEDVTSQVMDAPYCKVFDQAECRLHVAKALIEAMLVGWTDS